MNKLLKYLLLSSFLGLTQCGPRGFEAMDASSLTTKTGYETKDHKKYTVGKEPRLKEEIIKVAPMTPIKMTPEQKQKTKETIQFHEALKAFRFLRYDKGLTEARRLGTDSYRLDVQIQQENDGSIVVTFKGPLQKDAQGNFSFSSVSSNFPEYSASGSFRKVDTGISGKFIIRHADKAKVEDATVLYRAYEAQLNVRTPKSKDLSQYTNLQKKIENLRNNTTAWMNNFSVPFGVSTFDIAIIRKQVAEKSDASTQTSIDSLLSFSGRSVETDVEGPPEQLKVAKEYQSQDLESIELIGNAEGEDSKIFSVKMKDDKGETTEILVDVVREKTEEEKVAQKLHEEEIRQRDILPPPPPKKEKPEKEEETETEIYVDLPETDIPTPTKRPEYTPEPTPSPEIRRDSSTPSGNSPGNNSKSYMFVSSGKNALKIVSDFDKNLTLPGVQKEIKKYKKSQTKLLRFFKYANPFRGLIEKIAKAYKVPPQFSYVSVIESAYFVGGHYEIEVASTTTATGPFQIVKDTAKWLGMRILSNSIGQMPGKSDERRYFVPSACAAAKYFRKNAETFSKDATLAVLAYNQGQGRAADLAREYGYTFAEISRNNVKGVSYSNQKLAAYFIAGDYEGSKFDVDDESPKSLPKTTVFPANTIKDSICRSAVQ